MIDTTATVHADYPHQPGTLYDCTACETTCYCEAPWVDPATGLSHGGYTCIACDAVNPCTCDPALGADCAQCAPPAATPPALVFTPAGVTRNAYGASHDDNSFRRPAGWATDDWTDPATGIAYPLTGTADMYPRA